MLGEAEIGASSGDGMNKYLFLLYNILTSRTERSSNVVIFWQIFFVEETKRIQYNTYKQAKILQYVIQHTTEPTDENNDAMIQ